MLVKLSVISELVNQNMLTILSIYGAIIVLVLGILMFMFAVNLYNRMNTESARRLFLFTIFYLTSIQLVYIFDKFI